MLLKLFFGINSFSELKDADNDEGKAVNGLEDEDDKPLGPLPVKDNSNHRVSKVGNTKNLPGILEILGIDPAL